MDLPLKLMTVFIMLLVFVLISPINGMKERGEKRKRKRCPRVCLRELSREYHKLKKEIDRLKLLKQTIVTGPKGPPGLKGDQGLQGPPGFPGQKGEPGPKAQSFTLELPSCASDEFLTSNGKKLFCVKLDLKSLNVKDTSNERQQYPTVINPTISPEERKKMAVFERNKMIQTIRGDTWDVGVVQHGDSYYLFSSYLRSGRDTSFSVYKWLGKVFWPMKNFPITLARNWNTFVIDDHLYVAVASSGDLYSPVFKFISSDVIEEYQQVPVKEVFGVKSVYIGKQLFLVYNSFHGPTSSIYKWHNTKRVFVEHQTIKAFGSGLETFQIDNKVYLAFTAMKDGPFVNLYRSDGGETFNEYLVVKGAKNGYSLHHIAVGGEHLLAVTKYSSDPSLILRWDGKTFRTHQTIHTLWARSLATITSSLMGRGKEETYLAVANSKSNPVIYFFDKESKLFVKLQEMEATLTRDVNFFAMGQHVYIVVSAAKDTNIYRGSIESPS